MKDEWFEKFKKLAAEQAVSQDRLDAHGRRIDQSEQRLDRSEAELYAACQRPRHPPSGPTPRHATGPASSQCSRSDPQPEPLQTR